MNSYVNKKHECCEWDRKNCLKQVEDLEEQLSLRDRQIEDLREALRSLDILGSSSITSHHPSGGSLTLGPNRMKYLQDAFQATEPKEPSDGR